MLVNARPPTTKICLSVLLEFFDEGDEIAVAADDHVGVDVPVGERHLEGIEREVDVRAVLVAARRQVALNQLGRVLRERPAVVPRARPVAVGDLGDDVSALFERFEDDADVELHAQRALDPDFNVVEVDENRDLQSCVCQNVLSSLPYSRDYRGPAISAVTPIMDWFGVRGSRFGVGFRGRVPRSAQGNRPLPLSSA